jgi:hypothetical protein
VAVIFAGAFSWWFLMRREAQKVNAERAMPDYHEMKAQTLDQEIRAALPLGSSFVTVDEFLKKRDIEHSFDKSSKTVYATVRKLKGSTALTSESLTLKFQFDDDSKLKSIDSKVLYTGP